MYRLKVVELIIIFKLHTNECITIKTNKVRNASITSAPRNWSFPHIFQKPQVLFHKRWSQPMCTVQDIVQHCLYPLNGGLFRIAIF